jgi:hypothetical protein
MLCFLTTASEAEKETERIVDDGCLQSRRQVGDAHHDHSQAQQQHQQQQQQQQVLPFSPVMTNDNQCDNKGRTTQRDDTGSRAGTNNNRDDE